jgi:RNA polymerase sigma-70 factor (ECF subfamily)
VTGLPDPTEFERTAIPLLKDCFAFAMSLVGRVADAEDLVQETFLKAQRAFGDFEPGTNVKAWLFTILRRVHIDRHRRARIRPTYQPVEELESLAIAPAGDDLTDYAHVTPEDVRAALEEVPEVFRLPVRLRDLDGLSYREIGRVLDLPPGTVMSRIHRGRESLRQFLVRRMEGVTPPPGPASGPSNDPKDPPKTP